MEGHSCAGGFSVLRIIRGKKEMGDRLNVNSVVRERERGRERRRVDQASV